jgi:hypothetical protein
VRSDPPPPGERSGERLLGRVLREPPVTREYVDRPVDPIELTLVQVPEPRMHAHASLLTPVLVPTEPSG